jgi:hypothetical protein
MSHCRHSSSNLYDIKPDDSMEWTGRIYNGTVWWSNYRPKRQDSGREVVVGSRAACEAAKRLMETV